MLADASFQASLYFNLRHFPGAFSLEAGTPVPFLESTSGRLSADDFCDLNPDSPLFSTIVPPRVSSSDTWRLWNLVHHRMNDQREAEFGSWLIISDHKRRLKKNIEREPQDVGVGMKGTRIGCGGLLVSTDSIKICENYSLAGAEDAHKVGPSGNKRGGVPRCGPQ